MTPVCLAVALASTRWRPYGHAQEGVDEAKATAFDIKMFPGPLQHKTRACFVRRYDASYLARHSRQKVSAIKLL